MATRQEREAREARERLTVYTARQQVHGRSQARRRWDNILAVVGVVLVVGLAAGAQVFYFQSGPGAPTPEPSASATDEAGENVGDVPDPSLAEDREWTGTLTLNAVELGIALDGVAAPQAVASFVQSVDDGYFVGKTCHREVVGTTAGLIQCGSLDGTGATDPDYAFGPIENAPEDGVYPAGTIAMARASGDGYSQGRQFFVCFEDTELPADAAGGYTVLGTVTSGLDQLKAQITDAGVAGGSSDGAPVTPTSITAVTIQ